MLPYYVEWHMRQALAPILFDDDDPQTAEAARQEYRPSSGEIAQAQSKDYSKRTWMGCLFTVLRLC
jgi:hypothetical protein